MLSDEVIDKVVERLVNRIEEGNTYIIKKIGESIKKIGTLAPSDAQQLIQIMKYGGDYDKIAKKLAEVTRLNVKDIYKIFEEVAKKETYFAKQFYDYRGKKFIPYEKNKALKKQVEALAKITAKEYVNLTQTTAFATKVDGELVYNDIGKTYQNILDKAVLELAQGKESFNSEMSKVMKELAENGIRTVDYASGRSLRIDSAVRMQLNSALMRLHNEMQEDFGKKFDSDGIEISVHANPALDHAEAQGRQFSNEEWEKLQTIGVAKDYTGREINMHLDRVRTKSTSIAFRPIGQYNCRHTVYSIVLGVSKPEYSDKELQKILDDNNKGFDFDGKHYNTLYEGTQLQRRIELEIRKQKDAQIGAKVINDEDGILKAQEKIRQLTKKYQDLSNVSGLPTKLERLQVNGYKRVEIKK